MDGREWGGVGTGNLKGVRVRARFDRESPERDIAPGGKEREVRRDGPLVVDGSKGKSVVVRRRRGGRGEEIESEGSSSSSDGELPCPIA